MMDWLIGLLPWWFWLGLATAIVSVVWKVWGWRGAVAAAAGLAAVLWTRKVHTDAVRGERARQSEARDKLQEHYDEIDRQPIDPDDSYDRLRGMSGDKDRR